MIIFIFLLIMLFDIIFISLKCSTYKKISTEFKFKKIPYQTQCVFFLLLKVRNFTVLIVIDEYVIPMSNISVTRRLRKCPFHR